ncbi:MAG: hypothetical protein ACLFTQ_01915 [Candidatus Aenigmatarchaeota archaeon]
MSTGVAAESGYNVTLNVTHNDTGDPIENATVLLVQEEEGEPNFQFNNTTSEGLASFSGQSEGNYTYQANKLGFSDVFNKTELTGNLTLNISLARANHNITFNVTKEDGSPAEGAMMMLTEEEGNGDPDLGVDTSGSGGCSSGGECDSVLLPRKGAVIDPALLFL